MSSSGVREDPQSTAVETSNSTGSASARTNSQLPVACSEVSNSASVDQPRSHACMMSASCSPWQSGFGCDVPRRDCGERDETAVKSASEPAAIVSLHSDAAAGQHSRSSEPQIPCFVDYNDVGSGAESLISLRTSLFGDPRLNVNESRLSHDGLDDMAVVDASADQYQTSTQPGSCVQQSVSAVQCTQKCDHSRSQIVLPLAGSTRETPGLAVSDSTPGGGGRSASAVDRQLQMSDFPDNREAAGGGGGAVNDDDDDDENNRNDVRSASGIPRQPAAAGTVAQPQTSLSSAAVPPSTSTSRRHRHHHQLPRVTGSPDEPSSSSPVSGRQPSRRACHVETSADVDNTPSPVSVSATGAVTVYNYNMAGVTGPVQFGNGNVMYVGGAVTSSPQVRHHRPSSTSSEGRRHTRQKKQINVADREVDGRVLQLVSHDIGNDWKSLGRRLDSTDAKLDALWHDCRHDGLREVAYQMLRDWHERLGRDAKLAVLARALVDIRRPDVALRLQDTPRQ